MPMKRHTHNAFKLLEAAYPRWAAAFDRETIELWGTLVEDVPASALLDAVRRLAKTSKFPPTIAEIREAAHADDEPSPEELRRLAELRKAYLAELEDHEREFADPNYQPETTTRDISGATEGIG